LLLTQNLSAVTAACLLIRKNIYEEVAGLDEENLHVAFNDVDFCLKVREAGYRNLWTPYAELYHYESISRGAEDSPEKLARF
ncbi:glycosyltransferase family 2 protein, partial [Escherichia coli]|nr:glycosyltransferase family 2 protein [Escherichia coli]